MKSDQDLVKEFHTAFGLPVRDTPDVGSPEERVLRVRLILEEALEFAEASGVYLKAKTDDCGGYVSVDSVTDLAFRLESAPDIVQMAHELADLSYVVNGSAVQLGIPLRACMNEIHAANMNKLGPDGKPIVDEHGKVKKPEGWKPADVSKIVDSDRYCPRCLRDWRRVGHEEDCDL